MRPDGLDLQCICLCRVFSCGVMRVGVVRGVLCDVRCALCAHDSLALLWHVCPRAERGGLHLVLIATSCVAAVRCGQWDQNSGRGNFGCVQGLGTLPHSHQYKFTPAHRGSFARRTPRVPRVLSEVCCAFAFSTRIIFSLARVWLHLCSDSCPRLRTGFAWLTSS